MAEIEVEGKTVEDAIREGLAKLGCTRDNVEVKILNEGTTGLFGLMGSKPARVLLTVKGGAAVKANIDFPAAEKHIRESLEKILGYMKIPGTVTTSVADDHVLANIASAEGSLLIGKNGQTLEALEHIVTLIVNKNENTRVKVSLDTENYRKHQEERLSAMAAKAAEQVASTGRIYRFDPMPAKDRRILHLTLKDNPGVETFSEGEGPFRKVAVKPRKK